jgi:hypothetical protein
MDQYLLNSNKLFKRNSSERWNKVQTYHVEFHVNAKQWQISLASKLSAWSEASPKISSFGAPIPMLVEFTFLCWTYIWSGLQWATFGGVGLIPGPFFIIKLFQEKNGPVLLTSFIDIFVITKLGGQAIVLHAEGTWREFTGVVNN